MKGWIVLTMSVLAAAIIVYLGGMASLELILTLIGIALVAFAAIVVVGIAFLEAGHLIRAWFEPGGR